MNRGWPGYWDWSVGRAGIRRMPSEPRWSSGIGRPRSEVGAGAPGDHPVGADPQRRPSETGAGLRDYAKLLKKTGQKKEAKQF